MRNMVSLLLSLSLSLTVVVTFYVMHEQEKKEEATKADYNSLQNWSSTNKKKGGFKAASFVFGKQIKLTYIHAPTLQG